MKEILSAIPTFSKYQLFLLGLQIICVVYQLYCFKKVWKNLDDVDRILKRACEVKVEIDSMVTFRDTTFCACESCKNRECPHKLTRFVIADAVRMGVPVRVDNFIGDCDDYTEEEEE